MASAHIKADVRELTDREAIRDLARRTAHHVWWKEVPAVITTATSGSTASGSSGRAS